MIDVITVLELINRVLFKLNLPTFNILKLRQQMTYTKIKKIVPSSLRKLISVKQYHATEVITAKTQIYVMWWTGLETMPEIVRLCYDNLCNNAKLHPIILITKDNYSTVLPNSIVTDIKEVVDLYNNDKICIQHLSDIVRTLILSKIGGIWIDATIYVTSNWDDKLIGKSFFSGRRTIKYANSGKSITKGQWTSYFIASVKGNPLIDFMYNGLIECYNRKMEIKEYYTMDYLFAIAMKNSSLVREIIEEVPLIDANLFSLENYMNEKFDEEQYRKFMSTAPFFKLNHRIQYLKNNSDGVTVFGYMTK